MAYAVLIFVRGMRGRWKRLFKVTISSEYKVLIVSSSESFVQSADAYNMYETSRISRKNFWMSS